MVSVKSKFAGDIRQDVLEKLVPKALRAAAEKENLKWVGTPNIKDVHFHDGEPLTFNAEFEVAPEVELGDYRGLLIHYREPEVADADIDKRLDEIRERKGGVRQRRSPAACGRRLRAARRSKASRASPKRFRRTRSCSRSATKPPWRRSAKICAARRLKNRASSTSPIRKITTARTLAGRTVRFRATVKAVRRKELPELNDEFAKDLGDYQTLDELKDVIRKAILREREQRAQEDAKHQLIDKLVDAHDFPVPDAYIDRQIEINVENQLRTLAAQGIDPEIDQARLGQGPRIAEGSRRARREGLAAAR